jgi:molybdopterin synthase sulfur carrier subunit
MNPRSSPEDLARSGVTVRIPPALRSFTNGQDEVLLEAGDVASLLRELDDAFPGIRGRILDETGRPRPYVNVFVNDELVRERLDRVSLARGDAVHILPSVAGGSLG